MIDILFPGIAIFVAPQRSLGYDIVEFLTVERYRTAFAHSRRNLPEQRIDQFFQLRFDFIFRQVGANQPDAAVDIESNASGEMTPSSMSNGHAADGKPYPQCRPACTRHIAGFRKQAISDLIIYPSSIWPYFSGPRFWPAPSFRAFDRGISQIYSSIFFFPCLSLTTQGLQDQAPFCHEFIVDFHIQAVIRCGFDVYL
jgi:hypothetical protein